MPLRQFWPPLDKPGAYDVRLKTITIAFLLGVLVLFGFFCGTLFSLMVNKLGC
jgi:hypothetical protein